MYSPMWWQDVKNAWRLGHASAIVPNAPNQTYSQLDNENLMLQPILYQTARSLRARFGKQAPNRFDSEKREGEKKTPWLWNQHEYWIAAVPDVKHKLFSTSYHPNFGVLNFFICFKWFGHSPFTWRFWGNTPFSNVPRPSGSLPAVHTCCPIFLSQRSGSFVWTITLLSSKTVFRRAGNAGDKDAPATADWVAEWCPERRGCPSCLSWSPFFDFWLLGLDPMSCICSTWAARARRNAKLLDQHGSW